MTKTGQVPQLMQHDPVPKLTMHPDDAKARNLSEDELVRVSSRRGHLILPVQISLDIRAGVLFLPMHWGSMTAKAGRTNTLTQVVVDPISKEPEFKHTAVQVEAYAPAWRGVMLMVGKQLQLGREMIEGYSYGTVACIGRDYPVTWVEMACYKPLVADKIENLDRLLERDSTQESLQFTDHKHGIHKRAWLDDGRLVAVRWVGDDWNEAEWLRKLMLEGRDVSELRPYLLAPGGPVRKIDAKGKIICACQNVGELELKAAIKEGAASIAALKSCTMAGTGCGSCVPEMKRLLPA
jgi:assimilatory nitrate reductase catalytic subunit